MCDFCRYDVDGVGTINGEKMMQKLGITIDSQYATAPSPPPQSADRGEYTHITEKSLDSLYHRCVYGK